MIGRKATKALAELYSERFSGRERVSTYSGSKWRYQLQQDALYDYLYEREYDAWFLNLANGLRTWDDRALKELIMRLHTGESLLNVTTGWTDNQRSTLAQRLLKDLAEDILQWSDSVGERYYEREKELAGRLVSELELDGYVFRNGKLYASEATILDAQEEEGVLTSLIKELSLDNQQVMRHHLELSETHYVGEKWDDSISNSRKFLESVLQEIAARHCLVTTSQTLGKQRYEKPSEVRDYLESNGLLEPKEKKAIAATYELLSNTGSHPYIAVKDQARLLRYLSLTCAQFVLLRLRGALRSSRKTAS